jgi:hypothetical protein
LQVFHTKCKFTYKEREYGWKYDKELYNLHTGELIAKYERYSGGRGVLKIKAPGMDMVDVVVATGITMQYSWDQTRKMRSIEKWRKGGCGIEQSFDSECPLQGGVE